MASLQIRPVGWASRPAAAMAAWWRDVPRPRPEVRTRHAFVLSAGTRGTHIYSTSTSAFGGVAPPLRSSSTSAVLGAVPPPRRPPRRGDRAYLAMSGGVDSSVAALLAIQAGIQPVEALFMRNWSTLDESGDAQPGSGGAMGCEWQQDWDVVQRTADMLGGIKTRLVDLSQDYWTNVFAPALDLWASGTTPNPDVVCNREIKFGALIDRLELELGHPFGSNRGADGAVEDVDAPLTWLVTGHYAQIRWHASSAENRRGSTPDLASPAPDACASGRKAYRAALARALDRDKDQTYFLSSVSAQRLGCAHFPLATLRKAEVRQIAKRYALPAADKPESMGLCFVGERRRVATPDSTPATSGSDPRAVPKGSAAAQVAGRSGGFVSFLDDYIESHAGDVVDLEGRKVGVHRGLHTVTVGQRARLAGEAQRWFVARKDAERNQVVVVPGSDHPALLCERLCTRDFHWIDGGPPRELSEATSHATRREDGQPRDFLLSQRGQLSVQVRHRQREVPCRLLGFAQPSSASEGNDGAARDAIPDAPPAPSSKSSGPSSPFTVAADVDVPAPSGVWIGDFGERLVGVAPGQVAALYLGDECLGSGVIETVRTAWDGRGGASGGG